MQIQAESFEAYLGQVPEDKKAAIAKLRQVILENLPTGFKETNGYGMLTYVVPHELYPKGYHVNPKMPLGLMSIAAQKNFIALYHMGLYADAPLLAWFKAEYPKHSTTKLDMGKACIRFKKPEHIPYALIGELAAKLSPEQWIERYEQSVAAVQQLRRK